MLSICPFFIFRYELLPIGGAKTNTMRAESPETSIGGWQKSNQSGLKAQFPPQPRATPWVKMFVESNAL